MDGTPVAHSTSETSGCSGASTMAAGMARIRSRMSICMTAKLTRKKRGQHEGDGPQGVAACKGHRAGWLIVGGLLLRERLGRSAGWSGGICLVMAHPSRLVGALWSH